MSTSSSRTLNRPQPISNTLQRLLIAEKDPAYIYWILVIITLIGTILRLWKINEPIAYDEAYTFIYYASRPFKQILSDYSAPNNHILHTILVSISYRLFGGHPWIVRLPAFLAGTLCIPAGYFAARPIFDRNQSLAAASLVALTPWFVSYSTNGRGYTLLTLLALLLMNFAGILIHQQSRGALLAYAVTAALGFYTIPIFLYPMAGISLWVLATYLVAEESWKSKLKKIWTFLIICASAGLLTALLYSPVIFFGTGAGSIISNEFVEARDGMTFVENLAPRAANTWESWMLNISLLLQYTLLLGFFASLLFYKKASKQTLPLQICLVVAIVVLIFLQRVAPFPRVWLYLEIFYMLFAGAGIVWILESLLRNTRMNFSTEKIISIFIVLFVLSVFVNKYFTTRRADVLANQNALPEQYAAAYLTGHIQDGDRIFSIAPVDIRTAYYLFMNGIPYNVFYQKDHPEPVQNALIVLRTNTKYNTPESVLDFYHQMGSFNLQRAEVVFEYGPLHIISVPSQ